MLKLIYSILNKAVQDNVYYGVNIKDGLVKKQMPFIVYQVINKRADVYSDNKIDRFYTNLQITLVTKTKDVKLENKLEQLLLDNDIFYTVLSEYINDDKSVNRVYEIRMEEYLYDK